MNEIARNKSIGNKSPETNGYRKGKEILHHSVIQNHQRDKLMQIKKYNGKYVETKEEMEEKLIQYFGTIMEEDRPDRMDDIKTITRYISRQVTNEKNDVLQKPVNIQEVEEAVSQMADGQAPRPDRFTSNLFHHFWDMIKEEVWRIVEDSRKERGVLRDFNSTFLTLILKD